VCMPRWDRYKEVLLFSDCGPRIHAGGCAVVHQIEKSTARVLQGRLP
jgi:hypothetical protein